MKLIVVAIENVAKFLIQQKHSQRTIKISIGDKYFLERFFASFHICIAFMYDVYATRIYSIPPVIIELKLIFGVLPLVRSIVQLRDRTPFLSWANK